MSVQFQPLNALEERFAPILYRCLEAVGSTKGAVYLRVPAGGFKRLTHYGWPRGSAPPEELAATDPLLIMVQRARRGFALNRSADFPELASLGQGPEPARYFLSPIYLMGDWVGLLVQRDRQRHDAYEEDRDEPPTLAICQALAEEMKALRLFAPPEEAEELSAPAALPEGPEPHPLALRSTSPMELQAPPAPPVPQAAPAPAQETLSAYRDADTLQSVDWDPEPGTLPGTASTLRLGSAPRRPGMFTPEQRTYFWEIAALMCRLVPLAAVALWQEETDEARPILCYSPGPLGDRLKQQVLAHATFHLPRVREQDLRLLAKPGREEGTPLDGAFATQATLPLGKGSEDLLMVFRMEYAPLSEAESRALGPVTRLLAQYLEESRIHERYHDAFLSFAHRILAGAEGRSPGLRTHSLGCAKLARALALRMDLPSREAEALSIAAILHDVGGLLLDPSLQKKGELSPEEMAMMRQHPLQASGFLKDLQFPFDVLRLIRHHHERWDGKGYPDGLSGEAIPLGSRILTLVDAWEAMTEGRAYRAALSPEAALSELRREAGRQFDPRLVEAFAALLSQ